MLQIILLSTVISVCKTALRDFSYPQPVLINAANAQITALLVVFSQNSAPAAMLHRLIVIFTSTNA